MFDENWSTHFFMVFVVVLFVHALLASLTSFYYSKSSWGRLTHSQLRIKQGNATFEHRLNVFVHTLVFSFTNWRIYAITAMSWLIFTFVTSAR